MLGARSAELVVPDLSGMMLGQVSCQQRSKHERGMERPSQVHIQDKEKRADYPMVVSNGCTCWHRIGARMARRRLDGQLGYRTNLIPR